MGFLDSIKDPQTGEQVRNVTIYQEGAKWLTGREMKTDKGWKTIERISPYRYKQCAVIFTDGTEQMRDFDEPFRIRVNEEDINASI